MGDNSATYDDGYDDALDNIRNLIVIVKLLEEKNFSIYDIIELLEDKLNEIENSKKENNDTKELRNYILGK